MTAERLIFDIGFHNGSDTAHYLSRGCRVVAVEANPTLVAQGRECFAQAIREGRLELIGAGIAKEAGEFDFYVNGTHTEWSSFLPDAGTRGGKFSVLRVPTITMGDLLRKFGTPYYAKIDIEGSDWYCLTDLIGTPPYISIEAHRLEYLALLYSRGYRQFKIVNQNTHGRGFPPGSSGPMSDQISEWDTLETVAYDWLHVRLGRPDRSSLADGWFDFHAKFGGQELAEGVARPPLRFRWLRRKGRELRSISGKIVRSIVG
jgi:FkbM family methyltransferase